MALYAAQITFYTNPASVGGIRWGSQGNPVRTNGYVHWEVGLPPVFSGRFLAYAEPVPGYEFLRFEATGMITPASSSSNPTEFKVDGPGTITVVYTPVQSGVTVTFYVNPPGSGRIFLSNKGFTNGQTGTFSIGFHEAFAVSEPGYVFKGWSFTGAISLENDYATTTNVNVYGSGTLTANFIATTAEWTTLIYMAGDNNLESLMIDLKDKLKTLPSSQSVNIVILYDIPKSNTKILRIKPDQEELVYDFGTNADSGDSSTLETFIKKTYDRYPAKHYLLIFTDHGGGIAGLMEDISAGGIIFLPELEYALRKCGRHFDIIAMAACLMGSIEVAYQLQHTVVRPSPYHQIVADFFVGSADSITGRSVNPWIRDVINDLMGNPWMDPRSVAVDFVTKFQENAISAWPWYTIAAVDLGKLLWTAYYVNQLGKYLEDNIGSLRSQITTAYNNVESWMPADPIFRTGREYIDLYNFADKLYLTTSDSTIKNYCSEIKNGLDDSVISYWSRGHGSNLRCLSIYFPTELKWDVFYSQTDFAIATWWDGFLYSYYGRFDYWIDVSPSGREIVAGDSAQFTVTLTKKSGDESYPIDLYVLSFPSSHGTWSFSSSKVTPTGQATLTIYTNPEAPEADCVIFIRASIGTSRNAYHIRQRAIWLRIKPSPQATVTVSQSVITTFIPFLALTTPKFDYYTPWSAHSGYTIDKPSETSAWIGDHIYRYLAVRGRGDTIWWKKTDNTGNWGSWSRVSGSTISAPSICVFNNRLYIAVRGSGSCKDAIWINYMDLLTMKWSGWSKLGGYTIDAPSLAASDTYLFLAVRGGGDKIWISRMDKNGIWSNWIQIPGSTSAAPSITFYNGKVYICVKSSSSTAIYIGSVNYQLTSFSGWRLLDGKTVDAPTLSASGDFLYLAVRGLTDTIWYRSMTKSETWSSWIKLDGTTPSSPSICALYDSSKPFSISFIVRGSGNNLIWEKMGSSFIKLRYEHDYLKINQLNKVLLDQTSTTTVYKELIKNNTYQQARCALKDAIMISLILLFSIIFISAKIMKRQGFKGYRIINIKINKKKQQSCNKKYLLPSVV
ncbi:MAG: clostripain-related cysteine peptidase [Candidatus Bathyarchaeia archaeon]